MKMKVKVISGAVFLGVIPVVVTSIVLGWLSINIGKNALENQARDNLIAVRETKKTQIEDYFNTIRNQILTYANDRMIIDGMNEFSEAYELSRFEGDTHDHAYMREKLVEYYQQQFLIEYKKWNGDVNLDVKAVVEQLDDRSVAFQFHYISENSHPLGSKDMLVDTGMETSYNKVHKKYHHFINEFQKSFGYYDIFLVDTKNSHIIYSVFKELDYATSLMDGPYANSGIAKAYAKAKDLEVGETVLIDFEPYTPSYESPASFIASPIYDGKEKVGVLIFQMPVDEINRVMTSNQNWASVGLGASGETYLVGEDMNMRSMGRFLIEDKANYLQALSQGGVNSDLVSQIDVRGTTIGLQAVQTPGVKAALAGESGYKIFPDYRDVNVLSAYAPVDINGLKWAILSEIDEAEAFAPIAMITKKIMLFASLLMLAIMAVTSLVGYFLSGLLTKPIEKMVKPVVQLAKEMEDGKGDFTNRIEVKSNDELGMLSDGINMLIDKAQTLIRDVKTAAVDVSKSANQLAEFSTQTSNDMFSQQSETQQVATAMNEMTATVQEVAKNAAGAAESTGEADQAAKEGSKIIMKAIDDFDSLANEFEGATDVIYALEKDSENIGSVLSVIRDIAEQTNLLALNAAIEAARAGEQGRGFAVVADEVRTLASRTQESTQEIESIIDQLQNRSKEVVQVMDKSRSSAAESTKSASVAGNTLEEIMEKVEQLDKMNIQIASAAEEQSAVAEEVNQNVVKINDFASNSTDSARRMQDELGSLSELAKHLQEVMDQYTV